ncbi:AlkZ family DNA glycosylase [Agromyces sp. ISL-38]|uniref:winged helix DNA-binding domain-containing protein n=1 Tax=Agromyces sp. ISL-38 TaxID=2819107 RepID=UPI001BED3CA3|nr:winged helix DNA-binding domain-containing protein [Agromyces sp. ISL-38]MBT2499990.1 AlkZ family DNA glycosylase [Agromyces sp. ISL-38]MBT2515875.1 AlkZ family DNA glycosylase [Streptomyces sp. ISL-90]
MPKLATDARVRAARLDAHGLRGGLPSVTAAVTRLGATQAQDFTAAKWVIGARVPGSVAADVDAAIASREIVRSWPMRGTLHLLPTASLRPILSITGRRELQRAATRHRQLELDDVVYRAARAVAERELAGGASRSRDELQAAWNAAGIETTGQRGYHLIWWLANDAVVCWGPTEARGQRLVLLDEWAPGNAPPTDRDETLAAMFVAYVTGHGPATVRDFAWWSGLTLSDARVGLLAAGDAVTPFDDERFVASDAGWPADADSDTPRGRSRLALAAFDEYFLGYADRTAVCDPAHATSVVPGSNGVFQPILVSSGRVVGTWKRTPGRGRQAVTLAGFDATSELEPSAYRHALGEWARFWGVELGEITVRA